MLPLALDHHLWESCKAVFQSSQRSRLLHLAWYRWHEKVDRLFFSAFHEISIIRTFVANGSGAGVELFPHTENLVHSPLLSWQTSVFLGLSLKTTRPV
jgi:hypothetical protein